MKLPATVTLPWGTSLKSRPLLLALAALALIGLFFLWPRGETITLSGLVQATEVRNASRFGGRVKTVRVKEGDVVRAGDVLVEFDDLELKSKIAQAKALLAQAKAREGLIAQGPDREDIRSAYAQVHQADQQVRLLSRGGRPEELTQARAKVQEAQTRFDTARAAFDNAAQMLAEGIISRQKYDDINAQYAAAKSGLEASRANLSLLRDGASREQVSIARSQAQSARAQYEKLLKGARPKEVEIAMAAVDEAESALVSLEAQLSELSLKAPIPGVVSVLNAAPGELVSPGRPVFAIIDENDLWTDVYVPESRLAFVAPRQAVVVKTPAIKNAVFQGWVATVNPRSEFVPGANAAGPTAGDQAFRVKVRLRPRDESGRRKLYAGMKVSVEFRRPG